MRTQSIEYLLQQLRAIHSLSTAPLERISFDSSNESKSDSEGYSSDDEAEQILANNLPANSQELTDLIESVNHFTMVKVHAERENKQIRELCSKLEHELNEKRVHYNQAKQAFLATAADAGQLVQEHGLVHDKLCRQAFGKNRTLQPFITEQEKQEIGHLQDGDPSITNTRLKEILERVIAKANQRLGELKQARKSHRTLRTEEVNIVKALQSMIPRHRTDISVLKTSWTLETARRDKKQGVKNIAGQYYMARQPNNEPLVINADIVTQLMPHTSKAVDALPLAETLYEQAKQYKFLIATIESIKQLGKHIDCIENENKDLRTELGVLAPERRQPSPDSIRTESVTSSIEVTPPTSPAPSPTPIIDRDMQASVNTDEMKTERNENTPLTNAEFLTDLAGKLFSNEHQWRQQAQYRGSRLFCCSKNIPKHVKKLQQLLRDLIEKGGNKKAISLTEIKHRITNPIEHNLSLDFIVRQCEEILNDINITNEGESGDYQSFLQRSICGKKRSDTTLQFYLETKQKLRNVSTDIESYPSPR